MSTRISRSLARSERRRDPAWIALGALLLLSLATTVGILVTGAFLHPLSALFNAR